MDNFDNAIPFIYQDAHLSKIELPDKEMSQILDWYKEGKHLLCFFGNPGIGKSYLCWSFFKAWLEAKKQVRFYDERTFFQMIRNAIDGENDYQYEIARLCTTPHFILDDIGSGRTTEWQKEVFFSFLDTRCNSGYPTVITSNLSIGQIGEVYGERVVSRLLCKNNTSIDLRWKDKRRV